ncbi:DUF7344 domain-containing protein [Halogeometricum luteum]|uniref:DUF7344 domain-containing protein n=1 Tax=Halogeometricum luteum TaxID=2950537 RepID=A0ABU2G181_9EURY|nr:hypothetical protein [Halogeometricum sp. S3BR5-2]MDS0294009.1 hypothetical protein [Halogeometricum sp. S3BR5-2]
MAQATEAVTNTFSILSNPVRRYVLYYLDEQETPVSLNCLATRVATWHIDCDPDAVDDATLTEMRTALYHIHLPKFSEADYLAWNTGSRTIRRGSSFDDNASLFRLVTDHEDVLPAGGS